MGRIGSGFARVGPGAGPGDWCWGCCRIAAQELVKHRRVGRGSDPAGMQHLLRRASWDADAVRDDVRDNVVEQMPDDQAVLVVDETGDPEKGVHTVGAGATTPAPRVESRTPRAPSRTWSIPCRDRRPGPTHTQGEVFQGVTSGAGAMPRSRRLGPSPGRARPADADRRPPPVTAPAPSPPGHPLSICDTGSTMAAAGALTSTSPDASGTSRASVDLASVGSMRWCSAPEWWIELLMALPSTSVLPRRGLPSWGFVDGWGREAEL